MFFDKRYENESYIQDQSSLSCKEMYTLTGSTRIFFTLSQFERKR